MSEKQKYISIYKNRKLIEGYPDLESLGVKFKEDEQRKKDFIDQTNDSNSWIIECFSRLVDINKLSKNALDVGCGPIPRCVKTLMDRGFYAKGLEPVDEMRQCAKNFFLNDMTIIDGCAEEIPLEDNSQSLIILNSVLEHVDSPVKSLAELFRVIEPGGVLYISTTNKYAMSNGEFIKRFYQWYPRILKESYVFHQLHYNPSLARYTSRPAVHWFSFSELCKLGRNAGFYSFYSLIDLLEEDDEILKGYFGKFKFLFPYIKYSPFLRAFALTFTHAGSSIFMVKRKIK